MAYRNKTYVCFDGDNDMHYYQLMRAWKQNDKTDFNFYNAHELNTARDSSKDESIKRQLRERLRNTKVMVVLIGDRTRYLYKFVRWEMEQGLALQLPIIGVNLNGIRGLDKDRCPPIIREELCVHISYGARILQHALETWPALDHKLRVTGKSGPYRYPPQIYKELGL